MGTRRKDKSIGILLRSRIILRCLKELSDDPAINMAISILWEPFLCDFLQEEFNNGLITESQVPWRWYSLAGEIDFFALNRWRLQLKRTSQRDSRNLVQKMTSCKPGNFAGLEAGDIPGLHVAPLSQI